MIRTLYQVGNRRNGFFAGSAETLPALLFFSFSLLGCFGHIKGGNGIKKVFSG